MMTRKCTDPERWKVAPGSDACEDEVEAYLSHIRDCPFHAAIEQRHQQMVRTIATIARSRSTDGYPILSPEERVRIREHLPGSRGSGRGNPLRAAWQLVNPELVFRPVVILSIAVALALLLTTQLFKTRQPEPSVEMVERQQPKETAERPPEKQESDGQRSGAGLQAANSKPADLTGHRHVPRVRPDTIDRKPQNFSANAGAAAEQARSLQPIYIGSGFDPELRRALNHSFQSRGVSLIENEEQAGAILRADQTRGEEVMVELMNRSHHRLWWMSAKTANDSALTAEELADQIVNNLFKKIEGVKRTGGRAEQR